MNHYTQTSSTKIAALLALRKQFSGVDRATQCALLLEALKLFPVTTFEASRYLDIYHPPGRIRDLRDAGYQIETVWTTTQTEAGKVHRIGQYFLTSQRINDTITA